MKWGSPSTATIMGFSYPITVRSLANKNEDAAMLTIPKWNWTTEIWIEPAKAWQAWPMRIEESRMGSLARMGI